MNREDSQMSINFKSEVVKWKSQPVLTFDQVGDFFENGSKIHRDNFDNNKNKFITSKHYYKLEGDDLKYFKNITDNIGLVGKRAPSVILFTQKGVARLAKICGSERAWEVFEELEDTYFKVNPINSVGNDPILMLAQSTSMMRQEQINQAHQIESIQNEIEEIKSTTQNRKLIVEDPPIGYENKTDVIESVSRITQTTKAIVTRVLDVYSKNIAKKKYLVERIDELQIVKTWPVCYMTFDVINSVNHAVENSEPLTDCFSTFKTLGNKKMKYKRGA